MRLPLLLLLTACTPPPLTLSSVEPDLICDEVDGGVRVVVKGEGFSTTVVDALSDTPSLRSPQVLLHPRSGLADGSDPLTSDLARIPESRLIPVSEDELVLEIDGGVGLRSGAWDLEIRNPDQRTVTSESALVVAGPPLADSLFPEGVCQRADAVQVEIRGEGFLDVGDGPTVTVGGEVAAVSGYTDCAPLAGGRDGQVCAGVIVEVVPTALTLGAVDVVVQNPSPAACSALPVELEVLRPATVDRVEPVDVCQDSHAFDVFGTNLLDGTRIFLGEHEATVTFVDRGHLVVDPDPATPPGTYDLDVQPAHGCPLTVDAAVTVHAPPVVFDVDPPVVWSGADIEVVARASDVITDVADVWLQDAGGTRVDVDFTWDPTDPGVVRFLAEEGLPAADYTVHVQQASSCASRPAAELSVQDTSEIALDRVEPSFAWAFAPTPAVVHATTPRPGGEIGLSGPPRFWLLGPDGGPVAHPVLGVDGRSDDQVTTVLPDGLEPGRYTLLASNEDGALGVLVDAVTVVEDALPEISGVAPATLPSRADATLRISGRAFREPEVSLLCREGGVVEEAVATVLNTTWSSIDVSVPADRFGSAVCVVRVENGDGTSIDWAAVSITNPAQNLFPWRRGPDLVEARRAPAMAAGRTTSVSRFAYVIGGDGGAETTALDTIEVAPVGVYGDVSAWSILPRTLPAPRTRAGVARVGRFLYLVGGHDGTGAVDTLYRALILDPLQVPRFGGMDVVGVAGGLDEGRWHYRIAAKFPADHPANPGGESLPSEPISVTLPDGLVPTLTWTAVDGAVGYKVYRSPTAGAARGEERLLAEVATTSFTDDGTASPGTARPLPQGALGVWSEVATLNTPRSSACVTVVADPEPDPTWMWLYAAGGTGADGSPLDSIESVDIEIRAPERQVVGTFVTQSVRLSEARSECGAYAIESDLHSVVERGEAWVFFVGGITGAKAVGTVDAGEIGEDGELESWGTITDMRPARAGFGVLSASDFLYAFGGSQGRASESGVSANLDDFPDVKNWNSLGTSLSTGRYLPGTAQESAVVILGGGNDGTSVPTRAVDWTNW